MLPPIILLCTAEGRELKLSRSTLASFTKAGSTSDGLVTLKDKAGNLVSIPKSCFRPPCSVVASNPDPLVSLVDVTGKLVSLPSSMFEG